jgi:hypothetical protein
LYRNISTSFLPRFIEIVSAVLRKLKMHENTPPSPSKKKRKLKLTSILKVLLKQYKSPTGHTKFKHATNINI